MRPAPGSLHVAITVDPYLPVPPTLYGGIERVVDFLVHGLRDRGHAVTLFAHPESRADADLVAYGIPPHFGRRERLGELLQVGRGLWSRRRRIDVVQSFGRLASLLPILPLRRLPKVQSYQRDGVPWRSIRIATYLARESIVFTGCSTSVYRTRPPGDESRWLTIFNGVDVRKYAARDRVSPDAPLAFLGRLEPIKGAHHAIAIARAAGRRLVLAGNRVEAGSAAGYFEREIAPHVDGESVRYIGPVDDAQKDALLGSACALLMPIEWDEPFGIVMAEALACGTPVIGMARGSVPEVIRHGVNGASCRTIEDAIAAVPFVASLDRQLVRRDCEERFSADTIVSQYERLYLSMQQSLLANGSETPRQEFASPVA